MAKPFYFWQTVSKRPKKGNHATHSAGRNIYVKHAMSSVALHVVGGLVEVADPRDVVLPRDPDHVAGVRDND